MFKSIHASVNVIDSSKAKLSFLYTDLLDIESALSNFGSRYRLKSVKRFHVNMVLRYSE